MSTLQKNASWYNPMSIDQKQFALIHIVDGDKILFSFNWFTPYKGGSNSVDLPIELDSKLVRSELSKNKLRYKKSKDDLILSIDKSLLSYSLIDSKTEVYEYNDTVIDNYKLDNMEVYFTIRTQQKPNKTQLAYAALADKVENETRLTMYDIKRSLTFYNENKAMFKKAGI